MLEWIVGLAAGFALMGALDIWLLKRRANNFIACTEKGKNVGGLTSGDLRHRDRLRREAAGGWNLMFCFLCWWLHLWYSLACRLSENRRIAEVLQRVEAHAVRAKLPKAPLPPPQQEPELPPPVAQQKQPASKKPSAP